MDLVGLSSLAEVFREQELQQPEHVMDVVEVIHGLTALYERLEEERSTMVNIPLCVDMCLNWLLNVYDRWVGSDKCDLFSTTSTTSKESNQNHNFNSCNLKIVSAI